MSCFDFVALDFETATNSRDSACSIGIVAVKDGRVADSYQSLIRPPMNAYAAFNSKIHGITPDMTENARPFSELFSDISRFFDRNVPVVAHNVKFDLSVLLQSAPDLSLPDFYFFDTMAVAEEICPKCQKLELCASALGIDISDACHHHALDDALICARILLKGLELTESRSVYELALRLKTSRCGFLHDIHTSTSCSQHSVEQRSCPTSYASIESSVQSALSGKTIAFTGDLSISREMASKLASDHGAIVKSGVVKNLCYLVKGRPVAGFEISSKETKALKLIEDGSSLQIIDEATFIKLLEGMV